MTPKNAVDFDTNNAKPFEVAWLTLAQITTVVIHKTTAALQRYIKQHLTQFNMVVQILVV